jgi:hypothetical protein
MQSIPNNLFSFLSICQNAKTAKKLISFLRVLFIFCNLQANSQTVIFKSEIFLTEEQLNNFITSFTFDCNQIYFNANDYNLYAFDIKTGTLKWQQHVANKSNFAPIIFQNTLIVSKHFSEYKDKSVQFDAATGDTIQTLKIEKIYSKAIFKDSIMYCTAIKSGGKILAYDLKNNQVIWSYFIGHGVSIAPYYFKDKIIANAEGDNWLELDYNGNLLATKCDSKTYLDTVEVCTRQFRWLNYNQKELHNKELEQYETIKIKLTTDRTIAMTEDKIFFYGINNKVLDLLDLSTIVLPEVAIMDNDYFELLKVKNNCIWFFYQNILAVYDYKNKKVIKTVDLTKWNPHQIMLDDNNLWLISKNDGQLYGLQLAETEEVLDKKAAIARREKELACTKPDPERVAAEKAAKEKLKNKIKTE